MGLAAVSPLVADLRSELGSQGVLWARSDLVVYECDGFTIEKQRPEAVVFPRSTRQVADVVKIANRHAACRSCREGPGRAWRVGACRSAVAWWCCSRG